MRHDEQDCTVGLSPDKHQQAIGLLYAARATGQNLDGYSFYMRWAPALKMDSYLGIPVVYSPHVASGTVALLRYPPEQPSVYCPDPRSRSLADLGEAMADVVRELMAAGLGEHQAAVLATRLLEAIKHE